jgi:hypothetical protein
MSFKRATWKPLTIVAYKGKSPADPCYEIPLYISCDGKSMMLSNLRSNKLMARFLFWYFRKVVQSLSQS